MGKYKLKEGVELKPYGANSSITNDNLTDSIAEYLLSTNKANKNDFEIEESEPVIETKVETEIETTEELKEVKQNTNKNKKNK